MDKMKLKQLLIVGSLLSILMSGCAEQTTITESTAEPVVASAPSVAPVVTPEASIAPAVSAPVAQHCDKHHDVSAHDCTKHCKEHKKGKKDKACKVHCDSKAVATHDCTKHCEANHDVKDKVCAQHCANDVKAEAHACGTEHCAHHQDVASAACTTAHCA